MRQAWEGREAGRTRTKEAGEKETSIIKEIRNYCESNNGIVRWSTLQTKIYDAIRACLDVSRLDDMTDDQVLRAEKIFRFIKQERQENK